MLVVLHSPLGFCDGVKRAVESSLKARKEKDGKVYMLFAPVHNERVSSSLEEAGITLLEGSDPLELIGSAQGGTLLFGAHGHPDSYRQKAESLGIPYIDLTCPYVKAQERAMKKESKEHDIIYLGEENHQECIAALSIADNIFLLKEGTTKELPIKDASPIYRCQTTMELSEIEKARREIQDRFPGFIDKAAPCPATKKRQSLIGEIPEGAKLIVILGSKTSRNTNALAEAASKAFPYALVIRALDKEELFLHEEEMKGKGCCHLLSGASSDMDTILEAKEYLESL